MALNTFMVTRRANKLIALTIANPSLIEIHPPSNQANIKNTTRDNRLLSLSKPTLQIT
jgi:hypothetical protein